jgi:anti-anti-sigma regulatory factor
MLRISVMNEPGLIRMKLEGKLAHEWVDEARNVWAALSMANGKTEIVIDLLNVCFVDEAGHRLLSDIRRTGAELMGSGPLMSALIDEIEEAESTESRDALDQN